MAERCAVDRRPRRVHAYSTGLRNVIVGNTPPVLIQTAALTVTAFRTARVAPLMGRGLLAADETPGAPGVVVLGYDVWQRSFEGRNDVVGSTVKLGSTPVTVVGVMPKGFRYPVSYHAWTPLSSARHTARSKATRSASSAG